MCKWWLDGFPVGSSRIRTSGGEDSAHIVGIKTNVMHLQSRWALDHLWPNAMFRDTLNNASCSNLNTGDIRDINCIWIIILVEGTLQMSVITHTGLRSVQLWVCDISTGNFYIFPEIKYMFLCVTWMWGIAIGQVVSCWPVTMGLTFEPSLIHVGFLVDQVRITPLVLRTHPSIHPPIHPSIQPSIHIHVVQRCAFKICLMYWHFKARSILGLSSHLCISFGMGIIAAENEVVSKESN